tara:strand:- start:333 stop:509 length:177 start_codon:yes stop_codon:yes gene_type:complete
MLAFHNSLCCEIFSQENENGKKVHLGRRNFVVLGERNPSDCRRASAGGKSLLQLCILQ